MIVVIMTMVVIIVVSDVGDDVCDNGATVRDDTDYNGDGDKRKEEDVDKIE